MRTKPPRPPSQPSVAPADTRRSPLAVEMEAFLPAALTTLAQKMSTTASAVYRPRFGVGVTDWRIIGLLAGEPWIAPVRICEATGLDKAAVSRSLRDLMRAGLIETLSDEPNRRRVPVALTKKGLAVHDQLAVLALARQEELLKDFSPAERAQLLDFVVRLRRRIEAIKDGRWGGAF